MCELCANYGCKYDELHTTEVDMYTRYFEHLYHDAYFEQQRLQALHKNACWFAFEVQCATWNPPWPPSHPDSILELSSVDTLNYKPKTVYRGPVHDAPYIPPTIIAKEVEMAKLHTEECYSHLLDAYTYAPGGCHWRALMEGDSYKMYEYWRSSEVRMSHNGQC